MSGYRLSPQASRASAAWERSRDGSAKVVPIRRDAAAAEERTLSFADVYGETLEGGSLLQVAGLSAAQIAVTTATAMRVPAVSAAVRFIAETVASLPLDMYRRTRANGRQEETGAQARVLHDAVNDYTTSFEWRRQMFVAKLTGGRGFTWIERDPLGRVLALWPMDPARVTVRRQGWGLAYEYREGASVKVYPASEVIDLSFLPKGDGLCHYGPLELGADAIGLAIALTEYGSRFFAGGGVPPFAIEGNFQTAKGMQRATDDLARAVQKAKAENRLALALPAGHTIKEIGTSPDKAQMVEAQRFCIEQIARIYSLPPTFLQDLSHGTYSNTEQQDLHFVKHTLLHHVKQFEQELNLKLFGRARNTLYVEFNVDGLLRGDFLTRMQGWQSAIQSGLVTPNEARRAENWPDAAGGDRLFMQGANVPIDTLGQQAAATSAPGADSLSGASNQ